ncbi:MAG: DUF3040 domain-containing protein [Aeromicrobium sp.]|uniref:DUF3040 domain-containing protein n=1 Tax=Aeromicrobium sp. TaxID=1871063 RepID=UPI0025C331C1|nr:DUF3040 domain-containing protein [Aeromicrobium sp.]MCK5890590.1 DUF3040 domain-containing protein [Aeromicrobium sp.]MDF1703441.1 DUF3040 domain-containing protein [Aeromicrobium sp.]
MPLSDEEARLLQQLEQSLAAEDPAFASTLRGSALEARNRRIAVLAGIGFVAGLGVLFYGTMLTYTWLAVIGFVLMVGSGYFFVGSWRRGFGSGSEAPAEGGSPRAPRASAGPGRSQRPQKSGSFVERMEQRWQKRRDDNGGF